MLNYVYGMRLRGFSIGTFPKDGFVCRLDKKEDANYWDYIAYNRPLLLSEIEDYGLDFYGRMFEDGTIDRRHDQTMYRVKISGKEYIVIQDNDSYCVFVYDNVESLNINEMYAEMMEDGITGDGADLILEYEEWGNMREKYNAEEITMK